MAIDAARQTATAPIDERVRKAAGQRPGADDSSGTPSMATSSPGPGPRLRSSTSTVPSRVTARRYLELLVDRNLVQRSPRYGIAGRPEHVYQWKLS